MLVRAMGMEEEFGHRVSHKAYVYNAVQLLGTSERWIENGSRHYVDMNEHLESAGAEGTTGDEIMLNALANERLFQAALTRFEEQALEDTGIRPRVFLFKGNLVSLRRDEEEGSLTCRGISPQSYGCHENYQVTTDLPLGEFAQPLIPFLVTRPMMLGIGYYRSVRVGSISYQLSQRAWFMDFAVSSSTTQNRGILCTKDEPHSTKTKRLHLISGDNNFLPQNTAFKFDLMALMLSILEAGGLKGFGNLCDATGAMRQISTDRNARVDFTDGSTMTALEIQRRYLKLATEFVQSSSQNSRFKATLEHWAYLLELLEFGSLMDLVGEIDWATKRYIVEQAIARYDGLSYEEMVKLDLSCSQLHGKGSLLPYIEATYAPDVDWRAVEKAKETPPQTTRARIRGAALQAGHNVDWDHYGLPGKMRKMSDPLQTKIPKHLLSA
jgi:proteasome accessory factor A